MTFYLHMHSRFFFNIFCLPPINSYAIQTHRLADPASLIFNNLLSNQMSIFIIAKCHLVNPKAPCNSPFFSRWVRRLFSLCV